MPKCFCQLPVHVSEDFYPVDYKKPPESDFLKNCSTSLFAYEKEWEMEFSISELIADTVIMEKIKTFIFSKRNTFLVSDSAFQVGKIISLFHFVPFVLLPYSFCDSRKREMIIKNYRPVLIVPEIEHEEVALKTLGLLDESSFFAPDLKVVCCPATFKTTKTKESLLQIHSRLIYLK